MLKKFGNVYIDVDKIVYVRKISPGRFPLGSARGDSGAEIIIHFEEDDLTLHEDEPGYDEFMRWIEFNASTDNP